LRCFFEHGGSIAAVTAAARHTHPFGAISRFGGKLAGKRDRKFAKRNRGISDKGVPVKRCEDGRVDSGARDATARTQKITGWPRLREMLRSVLGQNPTL
jgi:hypothetical protein